MGRKAGIEVKFQLKLEKIIKKNNSWLCVGLDSNMVKLPSRFKQLKQPQFAFNQWIIEQTHDLVCAYKLNLAFYEARGEQGIKELKLTMEYLQKHYPEIITVADAKRGDIGTTNEAYAEFVFNYLKCDGITLQPYLGLGTLEPFFKYQKKGCIVLAKSSNSEAGEVQDLKTEKGLVWEAVARRAFEWNEKYQNIMLVAGATYPEELKRIRQIVGEMTLLVPGIGAQGGDVEHVIQAGMNQKQAGLIINSSRGIIFAPNPRLAAQALRDKINQCREE